MVQTLPRGEQTFSCTQYAQDIDHMRIIGTILVKLTETPLQMLVFGHLTQPVAFGSLYFTLPVAYSSLYFQCWAHCYFTSLNR